MDLIANCSTPCLNLFCWDLSNTWWFMTFYLFNNQLSLKGTWLMHQWFCCMCFCLPNISNPKYIEQLREMVPPPSQNTVGVCNQITFLILYYISSRLVTHLKVIDAPIQVPYIFYRTLSFKFINFSFQIFLLFFPGMSASFTSYNVYIIYIALAWILYPLHFILLSLI